MKTITDTKIYAFEKHLIEEEKAKATVQKYTHDIVEFAAWLSSRPLEKSEIVLYKAGLLEKYAPASANTILASLNSFFSFMERCDLCVKNFKIQKQIFTSHESELTKEEYERLLAVAKRQKNERLYLLMQTICSTGIRVSELQYITVDAVSAGVAHIDCKGKQRRVLLPMLLCQILRQYIKKQKIKSGAVFVSKNGNPLDRSNIWSDMKRLCGESDVQEAKVFPHNLRHLFARTYYGNQKDIVRLADILGHSSINTTRIYTMESGEIHRQQMQELGLLQC